MRLMYRFARFREITDEWDCITTGVISNPSRKVRPEVRRFVSVLLIAVLLFCIANSLTAFYIRSLIEDRGRCVSIAQYNERDNPIWLDNGEDEVSWPPDETPMFEVVTADTLDKATFTLDGERIDSVFFDRPSFSWFWQCDYLIYRYEVLVSDVHDGSVLELDCGGIRKTIVFHIDG
jgi:hypothetical protein